MSLFVAAVLLGQALNPKNDDYEHVNILVREAIDTGPPEWEQFLNPFLFALNSNLEPSGDASS